VSEIIVDLIRAHMLLGATLCSLVSKHACMII
jgi:hypothetical protein